MNFDFFLILGYEEENGNLIIYCLCKAAVKHLLFMLLANTQGSSTKTVQVYSHWSAEPVTTFCTKSMQNIESCWYRRQASVSPVDWTHLQEGNTDLVLKANGACQVRRKSNFSVKWKDEQLLFSTVQIVSCRDLLVIRHSWLFYTQSHTGSLLFITSWSAEAWEEYTVG